MSIVWIILVLALAMALYVRLAPSDATRWHKAPNIDHESQSKNSVRRLVPTGPDGLKRFVDLAQSTPRTSVLAGSVEDAMITFITRSQILGFPDYTTAQQEGDTLKIFGRSRFGRKDFGVNAARVDQWIDAL